MAENKILLYAIKIQYIYQKLIKDKSIEFLNKDNYNVNN